MSKIVTIVFAAIAMVVEFARRLGIEQGQRQARIDAKRAAEEARVKAEKARQEYRERGGARSALDEARF